jgi:hypothetical protein
MITGVTQTQDLNKSVNLILVYYVGVLDPNTGKVAENSSEMVRTIAEKIAINRSNLDVIFIPTLSYETRVECINPEYITEPELIRKHRLLMDELHVNLNYQLEKLKENNEK